MLGELGEEVDRIEDLEVPADAAEELAAGAGSSRDGCAAGEPPALVLQVQNVRDPLDFPPIRIQNVRSVKRIISRKRLRDYAAQYPQARPSLDHWERVTLAARWETPADVTCTFNDVDPVKVKSGNTVYVFNIQRNEHRLIASIHFNTQVVYVLRLLTHKEYDKGHWKDEL